MKLQPLTPEQEEAVNRSKSAAQRIEQDPLLKDYIRDMFSGKANALRRDALAKLTQGSSPEDAFEAKVIARTAEAMDTCYQIHLSLSQEPKTPA